MADAPNFAPAKPKTKNRNLLLIGGLAVGGIAGLLWFRKNKASSAASSSQSGIDPNTGVPYSQEAIDPNTGVPYADESSYGGLGVTPGALGQYNPLTNSYVPGYGTPTASVPASNAQWASAAETTLVADGYDPAGTAAALGLYLAGQPLTSDQYGIVQAALGFEGQPPTSVPAPVQIQGGGQGSSGNGSTGTGQTNPAPQPGPYQQVSGASLGLPVIAGKTVAQAQQLLQPFGFKITNVSRDYQNYTPDQAANMIITGATDYAQPGTTGGSIRVQAK